jgi:hypothetical protein
MPQKFETIIWREWFNKAAVSEMEKMGTLPWNDVEIDVFGMDGEEVAAEVAEEVNERDCERFQESGKIVILEPPEFAGTYEISVEYRPSFYASECTEQE